MLCSLRYSHSLLRKTFAGYPFPSENVTFTFSFIIFWTESVSWYKFAGSILKKDAQITYTIIKPSVPSSMFLPRNQVASRRACEPLQTCRSLLLLWEQSNLRRLVSLNILPSIAVKYIDSKIHHFIWSIFRAYWVTCVFLLFQNAVRSSCGALLFGRPQSSPPRSQGKKPSYMNQCEQCRKNVVQSWQKRQVLVFLFLEDYIKQV